MRIYEIACYGDWRNPVLIFPPNLFLTRSPDRVVRVSNTWYNIYRDSNKAKETNL